MKLFTGVGLGWLARRVPDWGGWILTFGGGALALYNSMPPAQQATIQRIFSGHWQDVTLGSAFGLVMLTFATWRSFHATVKPAVVTDDGVKAPMKDITPSARASIEIIANNAADAKPDGPLIGRLKNIFGK